MNKHICTDDAPCCHCDSPTYECSSCNRSGKSEDLHDGIHYLNFGLKDDIVFETEEEYEARVNK
jgi:hypothetical protein